MRVFFPGVRKFNDDSDSRCRHDLSYTVMIYSHDSTINKPQMSLPIASADGQDYTLELHKFIEDLSQMPDKTLIASELEGTGTR
jgi:hypothetical protein